MGVKRILHIEEHTVIIIPIRVLFILAVRAGSFISWLYFPSYTIYLPFLMKTLVLGCVVLFSLLIYENMSDTGDDIWIHFIGTFYQNTFYWDILSGYILSGHFIRIRFIQTFIGTFNQDTFYLDILSV